MKYYLKIGNNTRIINVGDFFVGLDGMNHTYNDVVNMTPPDLSLIGVHQLDDLSIDFEAVYNPTNILLRRLEEIKALRMIQHFNFRNDFYSATVRDLSTLNIVLSIANEKQLGGLQDVGNLMWFSEKVPFFWYTVDGNIRNMDIPTLKDLAKSMAEYIMACNACATILRHKIEKGEEVDIMDRENWPDTEKRSITENYEFFASSLVDAKYGDGSDIDDAYQAQLDILAGMME